MTTPLERLVDQLRRFDRHVVAADGQRVAASLIVVAAVVFVPMFSAWQVTRAAGGAAAPLVIATSVGPSPSEPVFSVRRIARTTAIEAQVATARTRLSVLSAKLPTEACLVVRTESRDVVKIRPQRPLIPASNMKLLVAATALDVLGADYRFETRLLGNRAGATIIGNLWLVGGGDPVLTTRAYPATQIYPPVAPTYLDALADELLASGITTITGSVVGDESRYDDERYVPTWGDGLRAIEAGPLGALMVDDGILVGEPLKPANPAISAATAFTRLLRARGINVIGLPRSAIAPVATTEIARLTSAPLAAILSDLLGNSDNNVAELLLKEIGLIRQQTPTRVAGLRVVADVLEARGIPVDGVVLADGSGLGDANRVTCQTLVSLLDAYGADSPLGAGLALAGATGTLRDAFTTGPASQRVRAKTGTLRQAKALSGFFPIADIRDGGVVTFSLVLNGAGVSNQSEYRPLWNELMEALSALRDQPTEQSLLPRS